MTIALAEALRYFTVDGLKKFGNCLNLPKKLRVKDDFVQYIEQEIKSNLQALWGQLPEAEKLGLAETLYSWSLVFQPLGYQAKYGSELESIRWRSYCDGDKPVPMIRLFLYERNYGHYVLPEDLAVLLEEFVPRPQPFVIPSSEQVSEAYERVEKTYRWQEGDEGQTIISRGLVYRIPREKPDELVTTTTLPLVKRQMEVEAQEDIQTLLGLVAKNQVEVSDKTAKPTAGCMKLLARSMMNHDFYDLDELRARGQEEIGPIKSFAWPLLIQVAKLASPLGKKLALSQAGVRALNQPPHEILSLIWNKWGWESAFDELQRIDKIKGQKTQGGALMTRCDGRRQKIIAALKKCPINEWVLVEDFYRLLLASGLNFDVTTDEESLHFSFPQHTSLDRFGEDVWSMVQGRNILVFLFEYVATLGLIDISYINPRGALTDFKFMTDLSFYDFFSRYDGLISFKLNPLGAYCLGLSSEYKSTVKFDSFGIEVLPNLLINATGKLPPQAKILLDIFALQESVGTWRLDHNKALCAIEAGYKIGALRELLQKYDEQPLPVTVEAFINNVYRKSRALTKKEEAVVIECVDEVVAKEIAESQLTRKHCKLFGSKSLVVLYKQSAEFQRAVKALGYGMLPEV